MEEISLICVQALTDNFVAISSLQDVDLSRNKSLRTLEVRACSVENVLQRDFDIGLLTYALSTITSPMFSEVAVFYREFDFRVAHSQLQRLPPYCWPSPAEIEEEPSLHHLGFEGFRTMRKVRNFRLVLWVDVWDGMGECCLEMLKQVVAAEKAKTGFDDIFPEPLIFYRSRRSRSFDIWTP